MSGRGVLWALCVACAGLLACALGSPAMAQSGEDEQEGLSLQPELGFDGVYLYGRWAPITVWSTAHTPMSGELSVRYGLDPTQAMRFATGFAATPGELAPAQLAAPMPNWLNELEIDANAGDAAGKRWTGGVTMSSGPGRRAPLPMGLSQQTVLIGVVGASSAVRAMETLTGSAPASAATSLRPPATEETESVAALADLSGAQPRLVRELREAVWVRLQPQRLPEIALGYDALALLIVPASAADDMSQAQFEAVRRWTRAGGRLLILASSAGDHWRRWLAGDGALPIALAGAGATPAPPQIARMARAAMVEAPADLSARIITLTPGSAASGWSVSWGPQSAPAAAAPGATGLLARGPFGLGWVTVLGVEPGGAIGDSGSPLATGMWLEAALDPLEPALLAALDHDTAQPVFSPWAAMQPGPEQSALTGVLDAMAFAPPAGAGAFIAIAIAAGALALLVGPIDYFLLGRLRARGRWWLTSLLWIGAASAVAWWGPAMLRTEPTSVRRHETIDIRLLGDASAQPAWTTGVTALFSAQAGAVEFTGQAPGSWWRGVSPLATAYWGEQAPTTLATPVRVRAPGPSGPGHGLLDRTPVRMWTLRTFLDHSEGRRPLAVRLAPEGDEVEVTGLPADEQIEEIAMVRDGKAWSSKLDGKGFELDEFGRFQQVRWRPQEARTAGRGRMSGSILAQSRIEDHPAPLALEGARRRSDTIDRLLATGRFAAIHIETVSSEPAVGLNWDAEYHTRRVYRILVPVEE